MTVTSKILADNHGVIGSNPISTPFDEWSSSAVEHVDDLENKLL